MIRLEDLSKSLTYPEYRTLLEKLLAEGKTTGHTQSAEYLDYAKLNLQRMARLEKTTVLNESMKQTISDLKGSYTFVAITEGWCGDASQSLPVFDLIAKQSSKITLKLLLRDDNPVVMDQYLTNGSQSIPKVVALESATLKELFVWGPRPSALQQLVSNMLRNGASKEEKGLFVQKWYNTDKTLTLQSELAELISAKLE